MPGLMLKVALVVGALILPTLPTANAAVPTAPPPVAAGAQVRASGVESLYSEPMYLPLRTPARVSCVNTNCIHSNGRRYHGDWAMDLLGEQGDPIYAAGNGIVHVGCAATGCQEDKQESRGKWVWIDHGGGEQTNYYHFNRIRVSEGQAVTPDTLLGEMGRTGDGRGTDYLHFERRVTDTESRRVYPGTLWACIGNVPVGYPGFLGYRNWDDLPKLQTWVYSHGTDCIPRPARSGVPDLVGLDAKPSVSAATASWLPPPNPAAVRGYRVSVSLWHPSTSDWDDPVFYTVPGTPTSWDVPKLQARRTYRVKIAAIDSGGYSPWSRTRDVVIASPPARPPITKLTPAAGSLRTVWRIPPNGGNKITGYEAVLTLGTTKVRSSSISPRVREISWTGLRRKATYTVSVVAVNKAGRSAPSVRRVRTR